MLGEQRVMEQLVGLGSDGDHLDAAYEKYWRERPQLQEQQKQAKSALELLAEGRCRGIRDIRGRTCRCHGRGRDGFHDGQRSNGSRLRKRSSAALETAIAKPPEIPPRAMVPSDAETPADESIRLAGQFDRHGEKVPRGFLQSRQRHAGWDSWRTQRKAGTGPLAHGYQWRCRAADCAGSCQSHLVSHDRSRYRQNGR